MALVYKQLTRQIARNKIFIALLFLLTVLTSLSFFFVRFSTDGNMAVLNSLTSLTENQELYKIALNSNTSLAFSFFVSLTGLTSFVLIMFFYRFFRSGIRQIGCLKSLGFKDNVLRTYFVIFVAVLSTIGALVGLL
jgi:putative ABC transport system permease protein